MPLPGAKKRLVTSAPFHPPGDTHPKFPRSHCPDIPRSFNASTSGVREMDFAWRLENSAIERSAPRFNGARTKGFNDIVFHLNLLNLRCWEVHLQPAIFQTRDKKLSRLSRHKRDLLTVEFFMLVKIMSACQCRMSRKVAPPRQA